MSQRVAPAAQWKTFSDLRAWSDTTSGDKKMKRIVIAISIISLTLVIGLITSIAPAISFAQVAKARTPDGEY